MRQDKKDYPKNIIPEKQFLSERLYDLVEAVNAYIEEGMCIPIEYIEEHNRIIERLRNLNK